MTSGDLDFILSTRESLQPSAGFVSHVMDSVSLETAQGPILKFPWLRFSAGLVGCSVMAGAGTGFLLQHASAVKSLAAPLAHVAPELGFALAAMLVTLGLVSLPGWLKL